MVFPGFVGCFSLGSVGTSASLVAVATSLAVASGPREEDTPPCQSGERTLTRWDGDSLGKSRIFWSFLQCLNWVVVSNIFYFHPYLGEDSHFLTNIFQRG